MRGTTMTIHFYARPDGGHIHSGKKCPMLKDGDFDRLGYVEVSLDEARARKLVCCPCMDKVCKPRRRNVPRKVKA